MDLLTYFLTLRATQLHITQLQFTSKLSDLAQQRRVANVKPHTRDFRKYRDLSLHRYFHTDFGNMHTVYISTEFFYYSSCLRCFEIIGRASGRAHGLWKL